VLAWFALTLALMASAASPSSGIFPNVTAEALDKEKIALPAGLEGQTNLLLLSFARDQENQLETWTAAAQALQHTDFNFRAYRIPVSDRANLLFRWWANASLRSDETDPESWHWVVPIYVDKAPLREQLGIADEKSVVALLVDRSGRVLWRATGASSSATRASLAAAARGAAER
jgi:hypothetical protein